MTNSYKFTPKISGLILFAISISAITLSFLITHPLSYILWSFIIPIFYGTHAAVHSTLIPIGLIRKSRYGKVNEILMGIGYAFQFMNYQLISPAHVHHHLNGRYDEVGAPDVLNHKPTLKDKVWYYFTLLFAPSAFWQVASYLYIFFPSLKRKSRIEFNKYSFRYNYLIAQIGITFLIIFMLYFGGIIKSLLFLLTLTLIWNLLQNVSHYSLKGIDKKSNLVCANTYIVGDFFRLITFGSLSHLAHHVDMKIPGEYLHTLPVLTKTEQKIDLKIKPKIGVVAFIKDVFRQFRGPLMPHQLTTEWLDNNEMPNAKKYY